MNPEIATVIVGALGVFSALTVCWINNYNQNKRLERQYEEHHRESQERYNETLSILDLRLENIEKKQDKHNNLIERVYKLEKNLGIDEEKIRNLESFHSK